VREHHGHARHHASVESVTVPVIVPRMVCVAAGSDEQSASATAGNTRLEILDIDSLLGCY
jgi:hypothetical protein